MKTACEKAGRNCQQKLAKRNCQQDAGEGPKKGQKDHSRQKSRLQLYSLLG